MHICHTYKKDHGGREQKEDEKEDRAGQ